MSRSTLSARGRLSAFLPSLVVAALVCAAQPALASQLYTVGGDSACSFNNLQQAIDAATDPTLNSILVADNLTYSGQHLVIDGKNINILGGLAECSSAEYTGTSVITGTSGHSVIEIEGTSNVYLSRLSLSGAVLNADQRGGGIFFGGSGALELVNVAVLGNQAGYGGGIDMNPSGAASLTLIASLIDGNIADSQGGGIRADGNVTLDFSGDTFITHNEAHGADDIGFGGGLEMVGQVYANISSNFNNNTAAYGGGIAALSNDNGTATVNLFATAAGTPSLYANVATGTGGGIYLKSSATGRVAGLCAHDFSIDANTAVNGAAIYADADSDHGSVVYLNAPFCTPVSPSQPPVPCATGLLCNDVSDNIASNGSAVVIQSNGQLLARRVAMRRNQGAHLLTFVGDVDDSAGNEYAEFHEAVLADNIASGSLIDAYGDGVGSLLIVDTATIANNQLGAGPVIGASVNFAYVTNSIVDQSGHAVIAFGGPSGGLVANYVLTNDTSSLAGGTGILQGAPDFVDTASGDYHQQPTSPGIDVAPLIDDYDLDGNYRTVDLINVPDDFGPADLGAYELQTQPPPLSCLVGDTIFCDGFDGA
jgi:hypothetical protein